MTRRIDPREAELAIARLRAANPARRGQSRQTPDQVDAFLLQVMERTAMVQDITKRVGPQGGTRRGQMPKWVGFAVGLAFAGLIAIPVLINRGPRDPAMAGLSAAQAQVIEAAVEAVNTEDFDAFRALFADEGAVAFETGFLSQPYFEGVAAGQPIMVSDEAAFEADFEWGEIIDRRLAPRRCVAESERIFGCEITSLSLIHI